MIVIVMVVVVTDQQMVETIGGGVGVVVVGGESGGCGHFDRLTCLNVKGALLKKLNKRLETHLLKRINGCLRFEHQPLYIIINCSCQFS
jgi:hypothetical protein